MTNPNLFEKLKNRGYVYQTTNDEQVQKIINGEPITFYLGIDPTADSLHIGHFFSLMMFRHLQEAGHKGILVIGGATALIGDPSGKQDMRKILTKEEVAKNLAEVQTLVRKFINTAGDNPALILDNSDWIKPYNFIDFMREVGIHFNINKMLSAETYANRLQEGGLTFLEMGYMLMQSYDFVYLNKKYGCTLQIGGSDQWGNIVAGVNLGRKMDFKDEKEQDQIFGLTCPLLMTKDGKKMGKSEKGALWVASDKTSVYDFYQYFYNVPDDNIELLLKLFTHIEDAEIQKICTEDIVSAKRLMAYEVTKLVHGQSEADQVLATVQALFDHHQAPVDMPTTQIDPVKFDAGIGILDLLSSTLFVPSKSEARRLIKQGGITVNDQKVTDPEMILTATNLTDGNLILKKGKKNFLKVITMPLPPKK
jgi:tyrosyl-tRNA synthetase